MINDCSYNLICLLDVDDKWLPTKLEEQIKSGISEKEIRNSWLPGINKYKTMRKKYLLYKDFE